MSFKATIKRSEAAVGMIADFRSVVAAASSFRTRRKIKSYCARHKIRLLHLGAGHSTIAGWIGTDYRPSGKGILTLDVTKPFPIESGSFDFIFCEHMIEHIRYPQAAMMLRECNRVLRPGGVVRIATPDLAVLLSLYSSDAGDDGNAYIKWITDNYCEEIPSYAPIFVVNNAFRNWGHKFLYDHDCLRSLLLDSGFANVECCEVHQSKHAQLRDLERHGENTGNEAMNRFETMVLEATRTE